MIPGNLGSSKLLLLIPILLLVVGVCILGVKFSETGEWFDKSIELKGGTLISVKTDSTHDASAIEDRLSERFGSVVVREIRSFSGIGITVQVESGTDAGEVKDELESMGIGTSDSSVQTIGPSLGESFWQQAQISIMAAFIIMGIIVFVIFRTIIPSTAVIIAAVSDIIVTLALMQVFSLELSLASFAALLMLIGYSIDTDILLTTRVIRNTEGSVQERLRGAFKTGMTMTMTTLAVMGAVLLTTTSPVLFAIASVLFIGLIVDIINTWLMNATILNMYAKRRGL